MKILMVQRPTTNSAILSTKPVSGWKNSPLPTPVGLLPDEWSVRLRPYYSLGVWFITDHVGPVLRDALLAREIARAASRPTAWVVGALGAAFALVITVAPLSVHGAS